MIKLTTFEKLLNNLGDVWNDFFNHGFVLGLQNGDLKLSKFKFYTIQDFLYLHEYKQVLQIGINKAKSPLTAQVFKDYLSGITEAEIHSRQQLFLTLAIKDDDIKKAHMADSTHAYCSYISNIAHTEDDISIICAIVFCAYSYEVIADKIFTTNPASINHQIYGNWIKDYISLEYTQNNRKLIDLFNQLTINHSAKQIEDLSEIFRNCYFYEKDFWDMAFNDYEEM